MKGLERKSNTQMTFFQLFKQIMEEEWDKEIKNFKITFSSRSKGIESLNKLS